MIGIVNVIIEQPNEDAMTMKERQADAVIKNTTPPEVGKPFWARRMYDAEMNAVQIVAVRVETRMFYGYGMDRFEHLVFCKKLS